MAIRFRESPESRALNYGASGGGTTLLATAITTQGETEAEVWLWALGSSLPFYNGFIRNDLRVRPKGAPHIWSVEIQYGTTGVGGGDQPLGGVGSDGSPPSNATAPASDTTPLTAGWSFSIQAPRLHLRRSKQVIASTARGGAAAPDFGGAIGVTEDRKNIEGVDWPPEPAFTFQRTVPRANVTMAYMEVLASLAGRTNQEEFYGFDPECVILMQADGAFTEGEKWSITFSFGVQLGDYPIEDILPGELPAPGVIIDKAGWHYLDVIYESADEGGLRVLKPSALYVHQVIRPAPFGLLEIG